ncbi:MAG: thiamine-phosphate kinase [Nanoarchaeota archaeon]|nr:thiamine-phosphate kinase [Nanoarchaeota archaeon]
MSKSLKDIGEFGLIKKLFSSVTRKDVIAGMGDDAAVVKVGGKLMLLSTDSLVEGVHFRFDWFSNEEIGRKAIEVNVSDINAMGGTASYVLVSIIAPSRFPVKRIEGIYSGMRSVCKKYDVALVGGNVAAGSEFSITVSIVGEVPQKDLKLRSSAKPGDFIFVSDTLGYGAAGLGLYHKKVSGYAPVKKRYRNPVADFSKVSGFLGAIHAMQDVTDGLVADVGHICDASKVGAVLFADNLPISDSVRVVAQTLGDDAARYGMFGGDDLVYVYTVAEKDIGKVQGYLIGEITSKRGVRVYHQGKEKSVKGGFDHFLSP